MYSLSPRMDIHPCALLSESSNFALHEKSVLAQEEAGGPAGPYSSCKQL